MLALGAAACAAATLGWAQVERLDLGQMVAKTDNAVHGTIVDKKVTRIDHPKDGPELYFTTLTIAGNSLYTGAEIKVDVSFAGGFINEQQGAHNSEAPSADDQKVGNEVVAFYKWSDNMGGDFASNALYAAHGGLYRTANAKRGEKIVLGRGEGYAVSSNIGIGELRKQIAEFRGQQPK
jgi:hypothetical protein